MKPSTRSVYRFPWSDRAKSAALAMATMHERTGMSSPMSYRAIAKDLHQRGLVDRLPDPASVRRLVVRELGKAVR